MGSRSAKSMIYLLNKPTEERERGERDRYNTIQKSLGKLYAAADDGCSDPIQKEKDTR